MEYYKTVVINNFTCQIETKIADTLVKLLESIDAAGKILGYEVQYSLTISPETKNKKINIAFKDTLSNLFATKYRLTLSFDGNKILRRVIVKYSSDGYYLNEMIDSYQPNGVDLLKPINFLIDKL